MIEHMLLKSKSSTAGATCGAKWENLPGVDTWWFLCLELSPQEAKQGFILWKQPHLMKHALNIAADSDGVLSEAQQHTHQTGAQGGARQQQLIEIFLPCM